MSAVPGPKNGKCIWTNFRSVKFTADVTLSVTCSVSMSVPGIHCYLYMNGTLMFDTAVNLASATYTITIPAGNFISGYTVEAFVDAETYAIANPGADEEAFIGITDIHIS